MKKQKSDLYLAMLSRLAYERPMSFTTHLHLLNYPLEVFNLSLRNQYSKNKTALKYFEKNISNVFYIRTGNYVYGYFIIINNILYIVFRGSKSVLNWITNLTYEPSSKKYNKKYEKGFHNGYIKSYEQFIEKDVFKYLVKNRNKYSKIVLTGHSAGAAYSAITAYKIAYFKKIKLPKSEIIGFGCPRFCDHNLMKDFNKKVTNRFYVNDGDLVTKRPLGDFADYKVYKKMKCGRILYRFPDLIDCHNIYLGVDFINKTLDNLFRKVFLLKINKTKHKTIKLKY